MSFQAKAQVKMKILEDYRFRPGELKNIRMMISNNSYLDLILDAIYILPKNWEIVIYPQRVKLLNRDKKFDIITYTPSFFHSSLKSGSVSESFSYRFCKSVSSPQDPFSRVWRKNASLCADILKKPDTHKRLMFCVFGETTALIRYFRSYAA